MKSFYKPAQYTACEELTLHARKISDVIDQTLSGIFLMIFLLIKIIKNDDTQTDINSAIGNAHHTAWSPPSLARINATGSSTTSCLETDMTRLYTPLPSA